LALSHPAPERLDDLLSLRSSEYAFMSSGCLMGQPRCNPL
jgi:hypothetical protein